MLSQRQLTLERAAEFYKKLHLNLKKRFIQQYVLFKVS